MIPFVYLESWLFTVPGVALGWITVINTILVMFPFSIVFIFEVMNDQYTRDILDNIFIIFPQYDTSMGLFNAFMREGLQSKYQFCPNLGGKTLILVHFLSLIGAKPSISESFKSFAKFCGNKYTLM